MSNTREEGPATGGKRQRSHQDKPPNCAEGEEDRGGEKTPYKRKGRANSTSKYNQNIRKQTLDRTPKSATVLILKRGNGKRKKPASRDRKSDRQLQRTKGRKKAAHHGTIATASREGRAYSRSSQRGRLNRKSPYQSLLQLHNAGRKH